MNSIEPFPILEGYNSILVIVCCLTKMAIFIATTTSLTAQGLARIFLKHVFSKHGAPADIVSDWGSKFTSDFWGEFSKSFGVEQKLSTAFHCKTDGQTKRVNSSLEAYPRAYVNYDQGNWAEHLPLAEFAYNNAPHSLTGVSPFFANKGQHPTLNN